MLKFVYIIVGVLVLGLGFEGLGVLGFGFWSLNFISLEPNKKKSWEFGIEPRTVIVKKAVKIWMGETLPFRCDVEGVGKE